jgi:aminoglycoside 6'-N-acetyltransferase I
MIHVRAVTPDDRASWLRMRCALWPEDTEAAHAKELAKYFAGRSHEPLAVLLAVDAGGTAIGFAELSIRSVAESCETDRVAYLEAWYVEPGWRRQGAGGALVRAAEAWGRAQGCIEFGSDTQIDNQDGAAAHNALGFDEVEQLRCFRKLL